MGKSAPCGQKWVLQTLTRAVFDFSAAKSFTDEKVKIKIKKIILEKPLLPVFTQKNFKWAIFFFSHLALRASVDYSTAVIKNVFHITLQIWIIFAVLRCILIVFLI